MAHLTDRRELVDLVDLYVQYDCDAPVDDPQWQVWFRTWLQALEVSAPCEVNLCLTTDQRIQQLNAQFRHIDQSTDVLSFAAAEAPMPVPTLTAGQPLLLGDIIISVPTAIAQAQRQNHSLVVELAWLATHGLLHLLGWDHPDDTSLQAMLERQGQLVSRLQLPPQQHGALPINVGAATSVVPSK